MSSLTMFLIQADAACQCPGPRKARRAAEGAMPMPPSSSLPHARGRVFETLDAYLDHLESLGTTGLPWYRRLEDGRYERVLRQPPGTAPEILTRAELAARFGFSG